MFVPIDGDVVANKMGKATDIFTLKLVLDDKKNISISMYFKIFAFESLFKVNIYVAIRKRYQSEKVCFYPSGLVNLSNKKKDEQKLGLCRSLNKNIYFIEMVTFLSILDILMFYKSHILRLFCLKITIKLVCSFLMINNSLITNMAKV